MPRIAVAHAVGADFDGKTLRPWRRQRGISQRRLARILGIGERTVQSWELGEQPIPKWLRLCLPAVAHAELNRSGVERHQLRKRDAAERRREREERVEWQRKEALRRAGKVDPADWW